jgi:putative transposase
VLTGHHARLLAREGASKDRRAPRAHPTNKKPELLATRPNEMWSWDITKLRGPTRGLFYDLNVILDIFIATSSTGWWRPTKTHGPPRSSSTTPW